MGSYPVSGDFFDNIADPRYDEPDDNADYDPADDWDEDDDYRYCARSALPEPVQPGPLSVAVKELRSVARQLARDRHPSAPVVQQIANRLLDIHAPAAAPAPAVDPSSEFAPSPTGNCNLCGRALPLPTMSRGRPRKRCTRCSPPRTRYLHANT